MKLYQITTNTLIVGKVLQRVFGTFIYLFLTILFLTIGTKAFSQIGLGVRLGGNLSHADALSFRSSNRLGFQIGGVLSYHFRPNMAIQAEPAFNLTRIRANSETIQEADGIDKGNKRLHFFELPVLFRLDVTRNFALLGGVEFNKLLNAERHLLNNGAQAFKGGDRLGYSFGIELGKLYFRYRAFEQSTHIHRSWASDIQQYQVGVKWNFF